MISSVRLRIIEIEGNADALLPLVERLIAQDGRWAEASAPPAISPAEAHIHHWVIDTPNGPTSSGRCSCGAVQEFRNSREEEAPPPGEPRRGALRVAAQTGRHECSGCHKDVRSNLHRRQCLGKDV